MTDELRMILHAFGGLSVPVDDLSDDSDLFVAGLSSLATVNVMLAVEQRFNIEMPDELLTRRSFQTISSLRSIVTNLKNGVMFA